MYAQWPAWPLRYLTKLAQVQNCTDNSQRPPPLCLFQLNNSLLNPPPFQVFVHVHGSPSTDPAAQNTPPLGHRLCLLTAFPGPSFTKPPHPDSWVYSPLIARVSFTVCNSTVKSQWDQISLFKANCLSQCYPAWPTDDLTIPHPRCLSGPASHQPSPSSSWPFQSPCLCCSSRLSDHCYQDRLILQTSAWVHLPAHSLPPTLNYSSLQSMWPNW